MKVITLIVATSNKGKLREFNQILAKEENIRVISALEAGITEVPKETGKTFLENAYIKAEAVYDILRNNINIPTPYVVLADDSGLCVDALDGQPGIFSARYAGEKATDEGNRIKLLHEIKDVPAGEKQAAFFCNIAAITDKGIRIDTFGRLSGIIVMEPQGDNGFGYDPIMYYPTKGKTIACMTSEEKNEISHRSKALKKMYILLKIYWKNEGLI